MARINVVLSFSLTYRLFNLVTEAEIPTTSFIAAAKQKRDTARKTGGITEDFISLSVTKRTDQGPHPESRLVREEDELGEADDGMLKYFQVCLFLTILQSLRNTLARKKGLLWAKREKKQRLRRRKN